MTTLLAIVSESTRAVRSQTIFIDSVAVVAIEGSSQWNIPADHRYEPMPILYGQ